MPRSFSRAGGGRRSSRGPNSKEWGGASFNAAGVASTTGGGWILSPPECLDDYESPTVIRLLVAVARVITTGGGSGNHGFGIYVATGDEDDVTVPTLLWDPIGDEQSDWVYRWVAPYTSDFSAGSISENGGADILIDVRTKRKIPRGAGLLAVVNGQLLAGAAVTATIVANVRCLIISG